jgi:hypothetical protein
LNFDKIHIGVTKVLQVLFCRRLAEMAGGVEMDKEGGRNILGLLALAEQIQHQVALVDYIRHKNFSSEANAVTR